jgi:hypothetical protein
MKRSHFYILVAAIGLLVLLAIFALYANDTETSPVTTITNTTEPQSVPSEPTESTTPISTTTAAGTFIIDPAIPIEERCTPVTLACLAAQPEWSPATEFNGMKRVDPLELSMFTGDIELQETVLGKTRDVFTLVQPSGELTEKYCADRNIAVPNAICPKYALPTYNEFAIKITDTDEIVHAYELVNNNSTTYVPYCVPSLEYCDGLGGDSAVGRDAIPHKIGIMIWQWDDINKKTRA